jgi:GT2 family glycosyltransferase
MRAYLPELLWRLSHPLKWLEQRPAYWRFRSQTKRALKQILLTPVRVLLKPWSSSLLNTDPLAAERQLSTDFYASLTLLPTPTLNELELELNNFLKDQLPRAKDKGEKSQILADPQSGAKGTMTKSSQIPKAERRGQAPNPKVTFNQQSQRDFQSPIGNQQSPSPPRVSLILVTYNNLALTHLCLMSLFRNTTYPDYEIIVVDNHSTDGTPNYLTQLGAQQPHLRLILNPQNYGFAHANNQGLTQATGSVLILLNNDTVVPPGWLTRLVFHLADPAVGLVGPVTNFAGNAARIKVPYTTWGGMEIFARERAAAYTGQLADIPMLAMYCLALRREVYEAVGPLDEQFGLGLFEDDDYTQRVRAQGYRIVCALDVFIHHVGQAAFGKLIPSGDYDRLFAENLRRYQAKWKVHWTPQPSPFVRSSQKPIAPAVSKNQ